MGHHSKDWFGLLFEQSGELTKVIMNGINLLLLAVGFMI